jgi:DNA-binding transcriptional LysR family regulator
METHRLHYFLRIADEGSLTRAAAVLGIAQPALSRQMHVLEETLGVQLFRRTPRGMQLTEEGEQLRASLAGPLHQLELAIHNVASPLAQLASGVVFGMPDTTACVLAAPVLYRFTMAFPKVKVRLVVRDSAQLVDDMLTGDVDLALIHGPAPDERLFESDLVTEDLVLVGGPKSDLSPERPVPFADLAGLPLVLPSLEPGLRSVVEKTAMRVRISIDPAFEIDSLAVSKEVIEAGLAYGLLPRSAVGKELKAGRLRYSPINEPEISQQLVFTARPQLVLPRNFVIQFGMLIRHEIADLVHGGAWPAKLAFPPKDIGLSGDAIPSCAKTPANQNNCRDRGEDEGIPSRITGRRQQE